MEELLADSPESFAYKQKLKHINSYIFDARGKIAKRVHVSNGVVPYTEYWLLIENKIVGMIQIRHRPSGRHVGFESHIYYQIVPSQRNRGYGTAILRLGLRKAAKIGLPKVLLTTDAENIASKHIIESAGGVLLKDSAPWGSKDRLLQYEIVLTR